MASIGRSRRTRPATFDEIARDYERNPSGAYVPLYDLVHLRRFFRRRRAAEIQPPLVVEYQLRRHREGASRGQINDELWTGPTSRSRRAKASGSFSYQRNC